MFESLSLSTGNDKQRIFFGIARYLCFIFGYVKKQLAPCEMQTKQRNLISSCRLFIANCVCEVFHTLDLVSEVERHTVNANSISGLIEA